MSLLKHRLASINTFTEEMRHAPSSNRIVLGFLGSCLLTIRCDMQTIGTPVNLIVQYLKPLLYKDFVSFLQKRYKRLKPLTCFHPSVETEGSQLQILL